ncbi:MAG: archaellin/type IV pilin N-terminal domain-containing protein [Thermoplasmatota archaeon]
MRKKMLRKEEGAIGIGTLIVFIALILVAAIAAAVIIGTAEDLEEKAESASESAQRLVESTPTIIIAEGDITASNTISTVYLYVTLYGSEGVDMRDVIIHVLATPSGGSATSADLTLDTVGTADDENFIVTWFYDPLGAWDPTGTPASYILSQRAQLKLEINLGLAATALPPDSALEFTISVTTSGHETYDYYRTPASYPTGGLVSLED